MTLLLMLFALDLWPGFDPRTIPVAIYDGTRTTLLCHPSPPSEFRDGVYEGRHPAVTANSSATIGGVATATVMPGANDGVIVHEQFHVYQRAKHPKWEANEADVFLYPIDDAKALALQRLEHEALRRALVAKNARCWTRAALALRRQRFARIGPTAAAYDRGSELNEGLATYIQHRVLGTPASRVFDDSDPAPESVRQRAYASGHALARLLDRVAPRWREQLEAGDPRSLDELLSGAVGSQPTDCAFSDAERMTIETRAAADAANVRTRRAEQRAAFLTRAGWRVTITTDAPLFPAGFDPLNLQLVTERELLHTRFVKLSGERGSLEVFGRHALTESAGTHPLFNGVRRITLTGFAEEPSVVERDGVTTISADGVTGTLRGAAEVKVECASCSNPSSSPRP